MSVDEVHAVVSHSIIGSQLASTPFRLEFLALFLGISILSVFPCHRGLHPPFRIDAEIA
jgi:hypothetical protein